MLTVTFWCQAATVYDRDGIYVVGPAAIELGSERDHSVMGKLEYKPQILAEYFSAINDYLDHRNQQPATRRNFRKNDWLDIDDIVPPPSVKKALEDKEDPLTASILQARKILLLKGHDVDFSQEEVKIVEAKSEELDSKTFKGIDRGGISGVTRQYIQPAKQEGKSSALAAIQAQEAAIVEYQRFYSAGLIGPQSGFVATTTTGIAYDPDTADDGSVANKAKRTK